MDLLPPVENRTSWDFPFALQNNLTMEGPQNFKLKLETGVKNGDCLPACFTAVLECLHRGCIQSRCLEAAAAKLRADLIDWIKQHWTEFPVFNCEMAIHEIMCMAHDLGITAKERADVGEWGEDPASRLEAYAAQCDRIYFSDAEMLLFSCMMYELSGLVFVFRTWRCTGREQAAGKYISTTPDPAMLERNGIKEGVIIDISHTGRVDAATAHYKLLDSGSLKGLTEVRQVTTKRRRLCKTSELSVPPGPPGPPGPPELADSSQERTPQ